jgi:magnesium-protoporphyrin O-methyltransferase
VANCCNPRGYGRLFNDRFARRRAYRYRRRGLDKAARRMVETVATNGVQDATVLEVGGGVGEIQIELLKRGAAGATNLELSPAYEAEAHRLLADAGLSDRADRRILDIAADPDQVAPADIVILHRVVCCYPDYARLLGAVADHARRQVVFSHPPRNLVTKTMIAIENLYFRLSGSEFRVFAHPPQAMREVLTDHGLRASTVTRSGVWQVTAAER